MHLLDSETTLQRGDDPDLATRPMTDVYRNFSGVAFGGWTMACAVEALQTHPEFRGRVLTANATFLDGLTEGEIRFRTRLLSRKRSTSSIASRTAGFSKLRSGWWLKKRCQKNCLATGSQVQFEVSVSVKMIRVSGHFSGSSVQT